VPGKRGRGLEQDLSGAPSSVEGIYRTTDDGYLVTWGNFTSLVVHLGNLADTNWFGMRFDLSTAWSAESERGLALEPPIFNTMDLTLTRTTTAANTTGEAWVFFVPEFSPIAFSGPIIYRPGERNEYLISYTNTTSIFTDDTSITLPIGVNVDKVNNIPTNLNGDVINSSDTGDLNTNWGIFQSYLQNSQFDGVIALSIYLSTTGNQTRFHSLENIVGGSAPGLGTVEHKFHSGQIGAPMRKRCRVRHDPKSGFPGLSDEFVDDGYNEGMKVLPDSWDPEDRTGQDFYPPPNEGVVDDEVP